MTLDIGLEISRHSNRGRPFKNATHRLDRFIRDLIRNIDNKLSLSPWGGRNTKQAEVTFKALNLEGGPRAKNLSFGPLILCLRLSSRREGCFETNLSRQTDTEFVFELSEND